MAQRIWYVGRNVCALITRIMVGIVNFIWAPNSAASLMGQLWVG